MSCQECPHYKRIGPRADQSQALAKGYDVVMYTERCLSPEIVKEITGHVLPAGVDAKIARMRCKIKN